MTETKSEGNGNSCAFSNISWQSDESGKELSFFVSNPAVVLPKDGLDMIEHFVSEDESHGILEEIYMKNGADFTWEGFDIRRKVLRFSVSSDTDVFSNGHDLPPKLGMLIDRIRTSCDLMGENPIREIKIEEYPENQVSQHLNIARSTATTFETPSTCPSCCSTLNLSGAEPLPKSCNCYVACIPLTSSLIEYVNRPKKREVNLYELYPPSENHNTCLVLPKSALVIKKKDFLFQWRNRIVKTATYQDGNIKVTADQKHQRDNRIVLLKCYGVTKRLEKGAIPANPNFGYVPTPELQEESLRRRVAPLPNLRDLLTILVTTSPVKSNPSTELLEKVFDTFKMCGDDFAYDCRKVIVCDGCRQRDQSTTKKHNNDKQSMRNGIVTADQNKNYSVFKQNLKRLCQESNEGSSNLSPFRRTTVHELHERQGYGFALRHALRNCVDTPYVIVIQHDRTFMRPTPIIETMRAMWHNPNIKYVGMSMRSNLMMRDQFVGQYGGVYADEMLECILRPIELQLDGRKFGPNSESVESVDYGEKGDKLRENLRCLAETYRGSQQYLDNADWIGSSQVPKDKCQLSLTPTLFWYDNVHICETRHYRDFIFDPYYKMVVKGGFVEDKLSPVIKRTVERLGLKEGHSRFGCFLLDDHSGFFFTGHLDGGSYMTPQQKQELIDKHRDSNARKKKNGVLANTKML